MLEVSETSPGPVWLGEALFAVRHVRTVAGERYQGVWLEQPLTEAGFRAARALQQVRQPGARAQGRGVIVTRSFRFDAERYAELEDIVVSNDGYSFEARAGEISRPLSVTAAPW